MTPQPTQHLRTMGTGRYPAGPPPPAPAVDLMASPQAQVPSAAAAPPDGTGYYPTFASEPRLKRSWSHRAAAPFTAGYGQMRRATTGWSLRRARSHTGLARPGPVPYLVAGYAQHALPAALEVHVSGGLRSKMFAMDRATGEVVFAWRRLEGLLEKVYEVLDLRTNARLALIKNDLGSHTFRVSDTHGVERLCLHRPLPWGEYQVSYPTPAGEATRLPLLYDAQHRTYWLTHPRASMAKIRLQNNTGQTVLDVLGKDTLLAARSSAGRRLVHRSYGALTTK